MCFLPRQTAIIIIIIIIIIVIIIVLIIFVVGVDFHLDVPRILVIFSTIPPVMSIILSKFLKLIE